MGDRPMYQEQSRKLQDQFDTRRLADRLVERLLRTNFNDEDRDFIESQRMFFLATTDEDGFPDCSYKGGDPGFVRVTDEQTLIFPSYDGNGMFKSLGNIRANPAVGLLFLSFEQPKRLRVNGSATARPLIIRPCSCSPAHNSWFALLRGTFSRIARGTSPKCKWWSHLRMCRKLGAELPFPTGRSGRSSTKSFLQVTPRGTKARRNRNLRALYIQRHG